MLVAVVMVLLLLQSWVLVLASVPLIEKGIQEREREREREIGGLAHTGEDTA